MRGGARPGAGRKPGPQEPKPWAGRKPRTWTLKQGDTLALWVGSASGNMATVNVSSRSVLYLRLDDGTEIKLVR